MRGSHGLVPEVVCISLLLTFHHLELVVWTHRAARKGPGARRNMSGDHLAYLCHTHPG